MMQGVKTILACLLLVVASAASAMAETRAPMTLEIGKDAPELRGTFEDGELCIRKCTETIQRIPYDQETAREAEEFSVDLVSLVDMNFDGFQDLQILQSLGSANAYYACYLWNFEKNLFEENEALEEIASPNFHKDTKEISSFCHGSATDNVEALYAWRNGRLTVLRRKTQSYAKDSERFVITEESLKEDGTLGTDFERSFSEEEMYRYLEGDAGVDQKTRDLMEAVSEQLLGSKILGNPEFHGEALTEGNGVTAWLVNLENGDQICFEVPYHSSGLYLNKGFEEGIFQIEFGEKIRLGKRVD